MKYSLPIILLLGYNSFSQTTLKGTVKDSLQVPLSYANVIAKPQDSLKNLQFSITDEQGRYKIALSEGSYTITASYLGYDAYSFEYNATGGDTTRNIILKEQENRLDEVLIELPVTVKQDTIIYDTKKFVTGDERKLKNVLKKLPGVEVDKNGTVTVQGKKVTTMLVENKKFFGGGSKLAVDNIPANAIDKVEVIDNYNEVAFLKNLSESDEMAMNIKLKEDKKSFVFGDTEAGKGNKDFYRTHSNLFYYSPKTNLNFIGNLNNTAEKTFTFKDYLNFQGGINAVFKRGSDLYKSKGDFSQFLESSDFTKSQNRFAALNITQEINNKLDISGYGIFSRSKEETFEQSFNQYNTFDETKNDKNNGNNTLGIGKITLDYTPNLKEQWYFKTQFKKTDNENSNTINSLINTVNNTFLTVKNSDATYFNQNIEWHKKASNKHTFSLVADVTLDKNNPTTFWETTNPILQGLIPIVDEPIFKLKQLKETKNTNFDAIFKHFWVLNRNNHIYSTIGNSHLKQSFFTDDSQELANETINNFNSSGFGNDLDFRLNDLFLGVHYKFRTGIFTFKQGAFVHSYNWKVRQQTKISKNKIVVLPDFLAKIEFSKSKKIKFNYNLKTSFSDASKYANRFYLQSYNAVYKGNENLENELYHSARLRYSRFSMYRGVMLFANVNYTKKVKGIKNTVNYQNTNQYLSPILIDNPEERWSLNGNVRKKIKNINYKIGLNYNTSKYLQKINDVFETNKNTNTSFNLSAKTLYDNFPTIEIGFKRSIGKYTTSNGNSEFITNEPFLNIDYDFLDGFIFSFDYTKYDYQNRTFNQNNKYEIANTSLYYKQEDSAWSFKIDAQNLLDVNFKNRNSFSSYIISDTKTYILPRIVMFTVGYNL